MIIVRTLELTAMPKKRKPITSKQQAWLNNLPECGWNATEAALLAGYKGSRASLRQIGYENMIKLDSQVSDMLTKVGVSKNKILRKYASLLDAKETKFFAHEGVITDQVDVEALGIQHRAAQDMARMHKLFKNDEESLNESFEMLADRIAKALILSEKAQNGKTE